MASKIVVQLTDDLDPSLEATDTIRFAFGNTEYEIDLADRHIEELRSSFDRYVRHARKVGDRRPGAPASQPASGRRTDLARVRRWAAENGVELNTRGRIAAGVLAAFDTKDVTALRTAAGRPRRRRSSRPAVAAGPGKLPS
jgi:Lsr2